MKKLLHPWPGLIFIFFLGIFLRFLHLSSSPPSLNWDEVSHGYNAYSILKTGRDEWGKRLPIINFRAYGDYPTTAYMYLSIPFIATFGLTEFSTRFPAALFGSLSIISIYFFTTGLLEQSPTSINSKNIALFAALLLAISPWHILPSRAVFQSTIALFFFISGVALYFHRHRHSLFLPLSLLCLSFSLFSYHNTRLVIPILFIFLAFRHAHKLNEIIKHPSKHVLILLSALLLSSSMFWIFLSSSSTARAPWVFVLDSGAINEINHLRGKSPYPAIFSRLIYNKGIYVVKQSFKNYIGYFLPNFLFVSGGSQYQYSIPGFGLLPLVILPFFYIGLIYFVKNRHFYKSPVLILLFSSPIPAALTSGQYHVIRSSLMLPEIVLISAVGIFLAHKFLKTKLKYTTKIFFITLTLCLSAPLFNYMKVLFTTYRVNYSWAWQYGYQDVVKFLRSHPEYRTVITTKKYGEPHEFYLFYLKFNPLDLQTDPNKIRYFQSNWYWTDRFGKYWFVNDWQVKDLTTERGVKIPLVKPALLVTSPGNYPSGWSKLSTINFLDGHPAFDLLEIR